jgi:hypothetical protein
MPAGSHADVSRFLCSTPRRGAAAPSGPPTGDPSWVSEGGCAVERPWPDGQLWFRVVCRRGLLGIEGFAVRVRFDPDRRGQRTVLTAVDRHEPQLFLEVLDPLESGVRLGHASDDGVAPHRNSLLAHRCPALFNTAQRCAGRVARASPPRTPIGRHYLNTFVLTGAFFRNSCDML